MIRCQKCGSEVRGEAKFCSKCGAKITFIPPELTAQIDILKKRIEKDSLNANLYFELGEIYQQNNLPQEALVEYQKVVSIDGTNFNAHLKSGDVYLKLAELEKAENSYKNTLTLNPNSPKAKWGLLRAYHLHNEVEKATELGEEIVRVEPNNLEVHRTLKEMYEKKRLKEKVIRELETITLLAPDDKEALKELAGFYAEIGESEKELKYYKRILELDPKDIETRFSVGEFFCIKGDYQKTIEYLTEIINELPLELGPYAHLYLALAYINQQDLDNAIKEITSVYPLNEEELTASNKRLFAEAYYKIGNTLFENKHFSTAINYLKNAIKYEPQNREYVQKNLEVRDILASKRKKSRVFVFFTIGFVIVLVIAFFVQRYLTTGNVEVNYSPQEVAEIHVDGNPHEGGFIRLKEGDHKIFIKGNIGYFDTMLTVSIKVSERKIVNIKLESLLLFRIKQNGKYGFIDKSGNIVIIPQFDYVRPFSEDLAWVGRGRQEWGSLTIYYDFESFINKAGQAVIVNRDFRAAGDFSDGLAPVKINGKWGYINKVGNILIDPKFNACGFFSGGLAVARIGDIWSFIDKTGRVVISEQFEEVQHFSDGLAAVKTGSNWKYIDKNGKIVLNTQYDLVGNFSEGLAPVNLGGQENEYVGMEGGKWGYIDKTGNIVIPLQFEYGKTFSEGIAPVKIGGRWGFIDKAGTVVIKPQFDWAECFSGGLAEVEIHHGGLRIGYINKKGDYVWNPQD